MAYIPVDQDALQERRRAIAHDLLPIMERMLEAESFTEISIDRLLKTARQGDVRVSRSSFYNHFEDKGDLLSLMIEEALEALFGSASAWWELEDAPSDEDLLAALGAIVVGYEPHRKLLHAAVEASSYDPRLATMWSGAMEGAAGRVRAHVVHGQEDGFVLADVDTDRESVWLTWMLERGLQQMGGVSEEEHELLLVSLRDIVARTLYETQDGP